MSKNQSPNQEETLKETIKEHIGSFLAILSMLGVGYSSALTVAYYHDNNISFFDVGSCDISCFLPFILSVSIIYIVSFLVIYGFILAVLNLFVEKLANVNLLFIKISELSIVEKLVNFLKLKRIVDFLKLKRIKLCIIVFSIFSIILYIFFEIESTIESTLLKVIIFIVEVFLSFFSLYFLLTEVLFKKYSKQSISFQASFIFLTCSLILPLLFHNKYCFHPNIAAFLFLFFLSMSYLFLSISLILLIKEKSYNSILFYSLLLGLLFFATVLPIDYGKPIRKDIFSILGIYEKDVRLILYFPPVKDCKECEENPFKVLLNLKKENILNHCKPYLLDPKKERYFLCENCNEHKHKNKKETECSKCRDYYKNYLYSCNEIEILSNIGNFYVIRPLEKSKDNKTNEKNWNFRLDKKYVVTIIHDPK